MIRFLILLSGIAWTIVYIDAIRIGFKHKTYAMPIAALGLNIAWETIYAVYALRIAISLQGVINLVWALFDLMIVYGFFRFGRKELPEFVTRPMFIVWAALVFVSSYIVQWGFILQFGWDAAPRYSAFLQNLLMSGLFIAMFIARRGSRGQTLLIAVAKWIGTVAPTILFGIYENSAFILALGILCCVFDLAYIALLIWARRQPTLLADQAVYYQRK